MAIRPSILQEFKALTVKFLVPGNPGSKILRGILNGSPLLIMGMSLSAVIMTFGVPGRCAEAQRNLTPKFLVPEGLEVTLWAESPQLYNPTCIDIDVHGRVWVAEAVNYRRFRGSDRNQPAADKLRFPGGDRIVILEDTDGDGICDKSTVFVQDKDLVAPLGLAVLGNKVVVSCSPNLIVYTDENGDDIPDKKEILLTGFGGRDHDHGLHSVVGGPDGRWYFNVGNAGPHVVTDRSGWTLRSGSFYTGGTPYNTTNQANMTSSDGRVWTGGLALRINPDGTDLTVMAHNFRNAYELALDSFGNIWQSDNDDQVVTCRTSWVMEGANMGYFSSDGTRSWRADRRPGQSIETAHWHQEDPGVLPAGDIYGAGGPTGVAVYEGDLLPSTFKGMVLNADAGRNTVFGHIPRLDGAGYQLERTVFLSSRRTSTADYKWDEITPEDRRTWFRPSDVAVGTDGSVYVADWYDPVVGGHAMQDNAAHGRILRVAPKGSGAINPTIELATTDGQIKALLNPAVHVRYAGFERLRKSGLKAKPRLEQLLDHSDIRVRARALWLLGQLDDPVARLDLTNRSGTIDADENLLVTAYRARRMHMSGDMVLKERVPLNSVKDLADSVAREAMIALRDVPFEKCADHLVAFAKGYNGRDRWYLEALGLACDGKEEEMYPLLFDSLGGDEIYPWTPAFAGIVWRLHPVASIPHVAARALRPELSSAERKEAVDTLAFIRHPAAANAMIALALHGPSDVRPQARWWVEFRAGNDWKAYDSLASLKSSTGPTARDQDHKRAMQRQKTLLNPQAAAAQREEAAVAMAGSREGGQLLLNLAAQNKLPKDLHETVGELIFQNPDLGVRALASQYFERHTITGKALPPVEALLRMQGDPMLGRKVFFGNVGGCSLCHHFRKEGKDVGPDLTQIGTKYDRAAILDSILNPSAGIAFGYETWGFTLENDEAFTGFILADGDTIILKLITGDLHTFAASDVVERRKQTLSIMPDNIALGLAPRDLIDLLAFLLTPGDE